MRNRGWRDFAPALIGFALWLSQPVVADESAADVSEVRAPVGAIPAPPPPPYEIEAGDVLMVSVWKEDDLKGEVLVQPDGAISMPLVGAIRAAGRSVEELRAEIVGRLKPYIPKPVVTVAVRSTSGNRFYVIGKVNKPGEFPLGRPTDVMQALSVAGGTASFAAVNDIVILRRENGIQIPLRFHYADVERGRELGQNILLKSGDTVVVP